MPILMLFLLLSGTIVCYNYYKIVRVLDWEKFKIFFDQGLYSLFKNHSYPFSIRKPGRGLGASYALHPQAQINPKHLSFAKHLGLRTAPSTVIYLVVCRLIKWVPTTVLQASASGFCRRFTIISTAAWAISSVATCTAVILG